MPCTTIELRPSIGFTSSPKYFHAIYFVLNIFMCHKTASGNVTAIYASVPSNIFMRCFKQLQILLYFQPSTSAVLPSSPRRKDQPYLSSHQHVPACSVA